MRHTLKTILAATALSAVAIVPVATIATVITADAAYANNGKGNGGGNGRGAENRGGGKEKARGGQGGKPDHAASRANGKGGPDPVGNFLRKLTGQEKKVERTRATTASAQAPARSPKPKPMPGSRAVALTGLHPSELGNMNGALNANENAILAHIRNGNTEGPVGLMAALAVASADDSAAEFLSGDKAQGYIALDTAIAESDYGSLEDYLGAVAADPVDAMDPDIEAALEGIYDAELASLLDKNDYADFDAYVASGDTVREIDDLVASAYTYDPDFADDVAAADAELDLKREAEQNLLTYWNKNTDASNEITEAEQALLDGAYDRLDQIDPDLIEAAIGDAETRIAEEDAAICDVEPCADADDPELVAEAD